jgi:hypothetical protein
MEQVDYFDEKAALYEALYDHVLRTFAPSRGTLPPETISTRRGRRTPNAIVTSRVLAELLHRSDSATRRALESLKTLCRDYEFMNGNDDEDLC